MTANASDVQNGSGTASVPIGGPPKVSELRLRRTSVHREHDFKRLQDGKEDLNDALLDFFVKLGQVVIPCGGLEGGFPSVAYLGSFFFDVLQKGNVVDGRLGHVNVANWAKRRLGMGGLFCDGIGALAVPVNETLCAGSLKERHWWLALLVNPRGGSRPNSEEAVSVLCLDSLARAESRYDPALRMCRYGSPGYIVEVFSLYRQSFSATVRFRARGDGTGGRLPDLSESRLTVSGREFGNPHVELSVARNGDFGVPGLLEGTLDFSLESSVLTSGEYTLTFGGEGNYPTMRLKVLREPAAFQRRVASFLGGYVAREWEVATATPSNVEDAQPGLTALRVNNTAVPYDSARVEAGLRLPDVPQQETANDCGYFMLEQILLALQLTPDGCRTLAGTSADMMSTLPWPVQRDIDRRKAKLKDAVEALFAAADQSRTDDVESLLMRDQALRGRVQAALWDGPRFAEAVRTLAALSAPRRDYTEAELEALPTKALRTVCMQHRVLPHGMVERSDLLRVLLPFAKRPPPEAPEAPPATPSARAAAPEGVLNGSGLKRETVEGAQEESDAKRAKTVEHLGSMKFTPADLETMPIKRLRDLCKQHGVLPTNALERGDFVRALTPLAMGGASAEAAAALVPTPSATPSAATPSSTPTTSPAAAATPSGHPEGSEADLAERKQRWAKAVATGAHLAGLDFVTADLEVMPLKMLRGLCVQRGVLPACAMERWDFVQALLPLVGSATPLPRVPAKPATPAVGPAVTKPAEPPRRDYSRFLGSVKPNFTRADLDDMPQSTMRTLCLKFGVLPPGVDPPCAMLRQSLYRLCPAPPPKPRPGGDDVLRVDDFLDDDE